MTVSRLLLSLHARRIDVVVFIVSAENHFTLSTKEFLKTASCKKAYIFIIINKFEGICNKEKCRNHVLDQIKELSLCMHANAADLVCFVNSSSMLGVEPLSPVFESLESSLCSFILLKYLKSKLHLAATYLSHLLSNMDLLTGLNAILASVELEKAKDDLNCGCLVLEKIKNGHVELETSLEEVKEDKMVKASCMTSDAISQALECVGSGELTIKKSLEPMPSYPGFLLIFDYIHNVCKALLASLDTTVRLVEDEAHILTANGVKDVFALGDCFLPEGVEYL